MHHVASFILFLSVFSSAVAGPSADQIQSRMKALGYEPEMVSRFMNDNYFGMAEKISRELETVPLISASKSPLRAVTLYRGINLFPSEYFSQNWKRKILTHDRSQSTYWMTTDLEQAEYYGRPIRWHEDMGEDHSLRGLILKLQIPSEEAYKPHGDPTSSMKVSTLLREEKYVIEVGSWEFSKDFTREKPTPIKWFNQNEVFIEGGGYDEQKMLKLIDEGRTLYRPTFHRKFMKNVCDFIFLRFM